MLGGGGGAAAVAVAVAVGVAVAACGGLACARVGVTDQSVVDDFFVKALTASKHGDR